MDEEQLDVRTYFTPEIEAQMNNMSKEQVIGTIRDLMNSEYWIAILRYNNDRLRMAQDAVIMGDPVKEPTAIARNQGVMLGISDLQNAVISLNMQAEQRAKKANEKEE